MIKKSHPKSKFRFIKGDAMKDSNIILQIEKTSSTDDADFFMIEYIDEDEYNEATKEWKALRNDNEILNDVTKKQSDNIETLSNVIDVLEKERDNWKSKYDLLALNNEYHKNK